jgi:hypothetical protein
MGILALGAGKAGDAGRHLRNAEELLSRVPEDRVLPEGEASPPESFWRRPDPSREDALKVGSRIIDDETCKSAKRRTNGNRGYSASARDGFARGAHDDDGDDGADRTEVVEFLLGDERCAWNRGTSERSSLRSG